MAARPESIPRKTSDLDRFELRVFQAVRDLKQATRREVGKILRVKDDPHSHRARAALVRLTHEGFLKLYGQRRGAYYTVANRVVGPLPRPCRATAANDCRGQLCSPGLSQSALGPSRATTGPTVAQQLYWGGLFQLSLPRVNSTVIRAMSKGGLAWALRSCAVSKTAGSSGPQQLAR
jgi:hypothetical protein